MCIRDRLHVSLLILAIFAGSAWAEWGGKGSFSPIAMVGDNGKPVKLTWTYLVNRGKPLYFNEVISGVPIKLKLQLGDLTLSIDPNSLKRTVKLSANVSGSATGQVNLRITESLLPNSEGKTLITDQNLRLNSNLDVQGLDVYVVAKVLSHLSPYSEWFLDRNDLDELAVGTIYDEQGEVSTDIQGDVCASAAGRKLCQDINVSAVSSPEQWEIMGQTEQLKVRNVTYANVVEVNRNTVVPAFDGLVNGSANTQPATITYWVAKGVGMVKGYGQYRLFGQDLLIELKRTAIVRPNIAKLKTVVTGAVASLKITGTGFGKTSGKIQVGGQAVNILSWKNTGIVAELPEGLSSGIYDVKLMRDNGVESVTRTIELPN